MRASLRLDGQTSPWYECVKLVVILAEFWYGAVRE
jgi:hypothetical protein